MRKTEKKQAQFGKQMKELDEKRHEQQYLSRTTHAQSSWNTPVSYWGQLNFYEVVGWWDFVVEL